MAEKRASDGIGGNDTGLNYKYTTISRFGKDEKKVLPQQSTKMCSKMNTFVNRILFYSSSHSDLHINSSAYNPTQR